MCGYRHNHSSHASSSSSSLFEFSPDDDLRNNYSGDILRNGKTAIQFKIFDNALRFDHRQSTAPRSDSKIWYKIEWRKNVIKENGDHHHHHHQRKRTSWTTKRIQYVILDRSNRFVAQNTRTIKIPSTAKKLKSIEYNASQFVMLMFNTSAPYDILFRVQVHDEAENIYRAQIEPFKHFETIGYRNVSLFDVSPQQNYVGEIRVAYLIIRPFTKFNSNILVGKFLNVDHVVYAGHRGVGNDRRMDLPEQYLENTIAGFNYICSKGAQMFEIDVHLTRDRVPIVFHDFNVQTFLPNRFDSDQNVSVAIPIFELTLNQLEELSLHYIPRIRPTIDTPDNQPFQTLQQVFARSNQSCAINLEIKYPQLFENFTYEDKVGIDMNHYVDHILEVIFANAETDRQIVINSFHPDICTLVRLKQNRYPVMFGTQSDPKELDPPNVAYYDPRGVGTLLSKHFAQSMFMYGLAMWSEQLLTHPDDIWLILADQKDDYPYDSGTDCCGDCGPPLKLHVWGDSLSKVGVVPMLLARGVHAVICNELDRILATF